MVVLYGKRKEKNEKVCLILFWLQNRMACSLESKHNLYPEDNRITIKTTDIYILDSWAK